jgi:hypothetical protein
MKQTSTFVQQSLEQAENNAKILGIQRQLHGFEVSSLNLFF